MATDPDTVEEYPEDEAPPPKGAFARYWERVGGGSFSISVLVHAMFVVVALLIVWKMQSGEDPEKIDFLSGGGGGTEGNTKINQKKQRMMVNRAPAIKLSSASLSNISIPDTKNTLTDFSNLTVTSGMMSGTPGAGGGFGGGVGTGYGKGFGSGMGPGLSPGFTASFLGMLSSGNNIIFCLDTSGSMRGNLKPEGIAMLRREMKRVISSLQPTTTFNLICFGQNGDIFKPKSVPASKENQNEVMVFLEGYYGGGSADFGRTRTEKYGRDGKDSQGIAYVPLMPEDVKELAGTEGGSRIDLAMVAAFERKPTTLFVLSDGAPGTKKTGDDKPMDKDELIKLIVEKYKAIMGTAAKLTVNTINIESDTEEGKEGEKFMRKLAHAFGGKHKEVRIRDMKKGDKGDKEKDKEADKPPKP